MSEMTNVVVTARKDWSEKQSTVTCKDIATGAVKEYTLWRLKYKTTEPKPADSLCVVGAKLKLGLKYVNEKPKPGGGTYPAQWCIEDAEPLLHQDFPTDPVEAPRSPAQAVQPPNRTELALTDKDRLILAQNAYRHAALLEASMIISMGHEAYEKDGGVNRVKMLAYDVYNGILELAKNDGNHFGK